MKINIVALYFVLMTNIVAAQSINRFSTSQALDEFLQYRTDRKRPLILAHRGGPGPADTENSVVTFKQTASRLPDAILEMDVRMTRDSALVMMHDATLDRGTTASDSVSKWRLADLKKVVLKTLGGDLTNQPIQLFADVVAWNNNRYVLALDVKPGTDPMLVMNEVVRQKAENSVFVICYSVASAQRMRQAYPLLWLAVGVNSETDLDRLEKGALSPKRLIALTPQTLQPKAFYERLHTLGIPCSVGTYGKGQADEQSLKEATPAYQAVFKQGGDILTTDRPVEVSALFN